MAIFKSTDAIPSITIILFGAKESPVSFHPSQFFSPPKSPETPELLYNGNPTYACEDEFSEKAFHTSHDDSEVAAAAVCYGRHISSLKWELWNPSNVLICFKVVMRIYE